MFTVLPFFFSIFNKECLLIIKKYTAAHLGGKLVFFIWTVQVYVPSETACSSVDLKCPPTSRTCWSEEKNWTIGRGSRGRGSERGDQAPAPGGLGCCPWGLNSCVGRVAWGTGCWAWTGWWSGCPAAGWCGWVSWSSRCPAGAPGSPARRWWSSGCWWC